VEGFSWALADYEMPEVIDAMKQYIKTQNDIPAPADIIKIMDTHRAWEKYKNPSIETILNYMKKGIPLSEDQKDKLAKHEAQIQ
jgi:hypothetical protein